MDLRGNLWHTYLTFLLVNDENAYSTSCEIVGEIEGSINEIALHDFGIFKELSTMISVNWRKDLGGGMHPGAHGLQEWQQDRKSIQPQGERPDSARWPKRLEKLRMWKSLSGR